MTALRDQLKACLSGVNPDPSTQPPLDASQLAERIKALRSTHAVASAPQRVAKPLGSAEEPVTARIRRRMQELVSAAGQVEQ